MIFLQRVMTAIGRLQPFAVWFLRPFEWLLCAQKPPVGFRLAKIVV